MLTRSSRGLRTARTGYAYPRHGEACPRGPTRTTHPPYTYLKLGCAMRTGRCTTGEFPSSEAPHERLNPRRASWGDERGLGLKITHHGAARRTPAPLPHQSDHERLPAHTPTRAPACPCGSVRHPLQEELLPKTPLRDLLRLAPRVSRRHDRRGRTQLGGRTLARRSYAGRTLARSPTTRWLTPGPSRPLLVCGHAECTRVVRVWCVPVLCGGGVV
jgi:hypothetical protein